MLNRKFVDESMINTKRYYQNKTITVKKNNLITVNYCKLP